MPKKSPWYNTAAACEEIGITEHHLRKLRKSELKLGVDYRIISSRNARRPTYQWHVPNISKRMTIPLESR